MASVVISGDTSGTATIQAQAVAGNTVLTLPTTSGNVAVQSGDLGTPSAVVLTNATGTANSLNAGIGVNQTWQNVTASRVAGTTYTNSTGKPIEIMASVTSSTQGPYSIDITCNGVVLNSNNYYSANAGYKGTINAIIPNGNTYIVTLGGFGSPTLGLWTELR